MYENFSKAQLEEMLKEIAAHVENPLIAYAFGGAVMVLDDIKIATKDIDLLFETSQGHARFAEAAKKAGFIARTNVPESYQRLGLSSMLENPARKWRLDLFTKIVCNKLALSQGMTARAKTFIRQGKLEVKRLSYEDIALLKAVADRPQDLDDIKAIWQNKGLDRKTLEKELLAQPRHLTYILPTLEGIAAKYGIDFRFSKKIIQAFEARQKKELDGLERKLESRRKSQAKE